MAMEKHGVCADEGDAPPATKQAAACCGARKSCGGDPMSKMADAVAGEKAAPVKGGGVFSNRDLGDESSG